MVVIFAFFSFYYFYYYVFLCLTYFSELLLDKNGKPHKKGTFSFKSASWKSIVTRGPIELAVQDPGQI